MLDCWTVGPSQHYYYPNILHCYRNLPLLAQLSDDLKGLRGALSSALDDISRLEAGAGVSCTKTRSVDEILDTRKRPRCPSQFRSADQISLSGQGSLMVASNVSSISTVPLPDISGRFEKLLNLSVTKTDLFC